jgi:hypothetical protein
MSNVASMPPCMALGGGAALEDRSTVVSSVGFVVCRSCLFVQPLNLVKVS